MVASVLLWGCSGPGPDDAGPGDPVDADVTVDSGPTAATCSDGVMNQDESAVDCGGTCGATCTPGDACGGNGDCTTDICDTGTCAELPTCTDLVMNGMESDVDCGGPMCMGCADGDTCSGDTDCTSAFCAADNTCTTTVCGDGMAQGAEDCDDGTGGTPAETATCDIDCTSVMCGDGTANTTAGEACDGDGAGAPGETATCDADCTVAECGDGLVNATAAEECDGDGAGTGGETATCDTDCTTPSCGDGVLNVAAGEACDDGNTIETDRCDNSCAVVGSPVAVTTSGTFDTDTGMLDGAAVGVWDAATTSLYVSDFSVATGVVLTVTGSNPLILLASGSVTITGDIDASGANGVTGGGCNSPGGAGGAAGPGGGAGGDGGGVGLVTVDGQPGVGTGAGLAGIGDDAGGGGGGHADIGGDGVADGAGTAGVGGSIYTAVVTLEGGSGGGGGSSDDDAPAGIDAGDDGGGGGGGGGGAVFVDALGDLTVTGTVDVSGGNGGTTGCGAGSGGGGSGGTIVLWADGTVDTSTGTLDVAGGTASTAGSNGGPGAIGEIFEGARETCTDGIVSLDETDVDCGGAVCSPCATLGTCSVDADCASMLCLASTCSVATCGNTTMDAMETDVDCGGPECPACADGLMCTVGTDCASTTCEAGACVSCTDGVMNGAETDVDCGGGTCGGCLPGAMCTATTDCLVPGCTGGVCDPAPTSCRALLAAAPGTPSGAYVIAPDGATVVTVYCDMTTDGGGWTLVASTLMTTLNDEVAPAYYGDLGLASPTMANTGVWDGMRALIATNSDTRFTCRATPGTGPMTVDLSFYDVPWYREFTTGADSASCFNESNGTGYDGPVARRDNVAATMLPAGDHWAAGYLEGEDSCGDTGDFTIDFDDRGMDSNQSDGTDWGEDDSSRKCGTSGLSTGEWHIWVREP